MEHPPPESGQVHAWAAVRHARSQFRVKAAASHGQALRTGRLSGSMRSGGEEGLLSKWSKRAEALLQRLREDRSRFREFVPAANQLLAEFPDALAQVSADTSKSSKAERQRGTRLAHDLVSEGLDACHGRLGVEWSSDSPDRVAWLTQAIEDFRLADRLNAPANSLFQKRQSKPLRKSLEALLPRLAAGSWTKREEDIVELEAQDAVKRRGGTLGQEVAPLLEWGPRVQQERWAALSEGPLRMWIDEAANLLGKLLDPVAFDLRRACRCWIAHRLMHCLGVTRPHLGSPWEPVVYDAIVALHNSLSERLAKTTRQPGELPRKCFRPGTTDHRDREPITTAHDPTSQWVLVWTVVVTDHFRSLADAREPEGEGRKTRPYAWWDPAEHGLLLPLRRFSYGNVKREERGFRGHGLSSSALGHELRNQCMAVGCEVLVLETRPIQESDGRKHAHAWLLTREPALSMTSGLPFHCGRCKEDGRSAPEKWLLGKDHWLLHPSAIGWPRCWSCKTCRAYRPMGTPCPEHPTVPLKHHPEMLALQLKPGDDPELYPDLERDDPIAFADAVRVAQRLYEDRQQDGASRVYLGGPRDVLVDLVVLLSTAFGEEPPTVQKARAEGWPARLDRDQATTFLLRALVEPTDLGLAAPRWQAVVVATYPDPNAEILDVNEHELTTGHSKLSAQLERTLRCN